MLLISFSGACYHFESQAASAALAAVKCAQLKGGRLASAASASDINSIKQSAPSISLAHWVGFYRNSASGTRFITSDGKRQLKETHFDSSLFASADALDR